MSWKPLRKVTAQRVKGVNKEKRLVLREKWGEVIENGSVGLTRVSWADEKIFRLGGARR